MLFESGEQPVKDVLTADLALPRGIVALKLESWSEVQGGDEERARLADRFKIAVHLNRPGAVAIAEHPSVHLAAKLAHFGALIGRRELARLVIQSFDLLRDGEVLMVTRVFTLGWRADFEQQDWPVWVVLKLSSAITISAVRPSANRGPSDMPSRLSAVTPIEAIDQQGLLHGLPGIRPRQSLQAGAVIRTVPFSSWLASRFSQPAGRLAPKPRPAAAP